MTRFDRLPPAPDHLQPATKQWYSSFLSTNALEEHHRRLLQAACEAWDSMQAARAAIAANEGAVRRAGR
jgi:phage terminase small subunit